ncbi:RecA-family ATPase [Bradyrhizobium sp. USDA 326]|uniref:AAA family ATPase n=1 Tax=unclassified Bradyrhizobium TaxID=2631580 RepID=UPI0035133A1D
MSEPPDDMDANDVLRSAGSDGLREMFDRAERKVIPLRDVVEPAKPARLRPISVARWDHVAVPEPDWTVFNRIPRRQTCLFSGEGAMGKSTLLLQLCAAHVLGKDWLHTLPEPGPAIFLDAEDDQDVMHRRLAAIVKHYGVTFADLAAGLSLLAMVGEDCVLAQSTGKSGRIEPTPLYHELLTFVGDVKPVMIGLASAANVFAGNENDRSEVQQFIGLCTRLAIVANGSLVLVSHPSNAGIQTGTGVSGSTAWHNAVRARFFLHGVKKQNEADGAEPDNDLREIEFMKNNYGPRAERLTLRWQDGLFLPERKRSAMQQAAQDQRDDEVFATVLARFVSQNRAVSANPGRSYAPSQFAGEKEAKAAHVNGVRLKAAMDRLMESGRVRIEVTGPPSRQRSRLVLR